MPTFLAIFGVGGKRIVVRSHVSDEVETIFEFDMRSLDGAYHVPSFIAAVSRKMGIGTQMHIATDEDLADGTNIIVLELLSEDVKLQNPFSFAKWESVKHLVETKCRVPSIGEYLVSFLEGKSLSLPGREATPWYRIGYYQHIEPRIMNAVKHAGLIAVTKPDQLRLSSISVIYKISVKTVNSPKREETHFDVFYKVVPKGSMEVLFTSLMCGLFPNSTGKLLYIDEEIGAFLSGDFGPNLCELGVQGIPERYGDRVQKLVDGAITQWAQIQRASVKHIQHLKHSGVPLYDIQWYNQGLEKVMQYLEGKQEIMAGTTVRARRLLEKVSVLWEHAGIPYTIVHGDLHPENVSTPRESKSVFVFYDWEDLCITHPFLDISDNQLGGAFKQNAAYCNSWEHYCRDGSLLESIAEAADSLHWLRKAVDVMSRKYLWHEAKEERVLEYFNEFTSAIATIKWIDD